MFAATTTWKAAYPDAHAGFLILRDVVNPSRHAGLEAKKTLLEQELRMRFGEQDRKSIARDPILDAYAQYYRQFNKTYHLQLQLESIVHKKKPIPSVAALVEAMFMAEMKNFLLTAGHDLDAVQTGITVDVANGEEKYLVLRGQEQMSKEGDMLMRDGEGVISTILYGPDQRTQIYAQTRNAVFTVYAPSGIRPEVVRNHLEDIREYVTVFAPQSHTEILQVFGGDE
jgi:DNA/RNA-binding domain of Phe-tRNA-synthetase-like protein